MELAAVTGFRGMPFYFNLTTPVGKGYPNARLDDVSFVQFCFVVGSVGKPTPPPADVQKEWSQVSVTGRTDAATLAAISAWQGFRRRRFGAHVETDGIISVAHTASGLYAPETSYDIVHLNFLVLVATASIWPRVDKDPHCTAELGAAIRQALSQHLTT
jgi:hypothetical protein